MKISEDYETIQLERDSIVSQKRDLQAKLETLRDELATKTKLLNQVGTDNLHLNDRLNRLEKEAAKSQDQVHSQRLQLENQRIEMKTTAEGFARNFREREQDLLTKIQEQQSYLEEITFKYNEVLKKARYTATPH